MIVKGFSQRAQRYGGSGDPQNEKREESPEFCTAGSMDRMGRGLAKVPDME